MSILIELIDVDGRDNDLLAVFFFLILASLQIIVAGNAEYIRIVRLSMSGSVYKDRAKYLVFLQASSVRVQK